MNHFYCVKCKMQNKYFKIQKLYLNYCSKLSDNIFDIYDIGNDENN